MRLIIVLCISVLDEILLEINKLPYIIGSYLIIVNIY